MRIAIVSQFCFVLSLISGCSPLQAPPLSMRIDAHRHLNVDREQVSLPVRLQIYQLSDDTAFNEATFTQLWKADANVLGADLLAKKAITINPGQSQIIKLNRRSDAQFLGVVGLFRRHRDGGWKVIKSMPNPVATVLGQTVITVKGYDIEVQ